jgi:hypothetical protein
LANSKKPGIFVVDLTSLELPDDVQTRIAQAIRKAVLVEVASLDIAPDLSVQFNSVELPQNLRPPPVGVVLRPTDKS